MCDISTFKKLLQYYDKNNNQAIRHSELWFYKGFVHYKQQRGMFFPWKVRDLLTSMKILHTKESQGDLFVWGQASPPQRLVC